MTVPFVKITEEEIKSNRPFSPPEELVAWLRSPKKLFIGGSFIDGEEVFSSSNPATDEKLADIHSAGRNEVEAAVSAGRVAFEQGEWANLPLEKRATILRQIGDAILKHRIPLAILESLDTGKPIRESYDGDIPRAAQNFHFFADFALRENKTESWENGEGVKSVIDKHTAYREPMGVVALITPWNLPLYLETWKIAPALLMGNSVILKPSELTPLTACYFTELLAELFETHSLPKGVFQLLNGFGEGATGEFLVSHPGVDAISFTGETGTGRAIMKAASVGPTRLSFELGGKGASIVFADCDQKNALNEIVRAGFRNQGEICLASPRIFIERPLYEDFKKILIDRVRSLRVGNPLTWETEMGAVISREHFEKVQGYIKTIVSPAKILCGGERVGNQGNFISPVVAEGLAKDHPVSCQEVFGPLVSLYPFDTETEVVDGVNATPYGLSASVYTKDASRAERVSRSLKVGLVWINGWFRRDLRVPFGGQKRSGVGREGGRHSLDFYSEWKSVCTVGGVS